MNFQKEWWKSGLKYWPLALLDLIMFMFILQAIHFDYASLGYSQKAYTLSIILLSYLMFLFNDLFFDKVVEDMKSKGYMKNARK